MNWYKGSIAEAVALSKKTDSIFVVFVEGKDEASQKLVRFINDTKIRSKLETNNFVAVRIESETEAYTQFASIYKLVPIPSIYFIGQSGAPIEIGTGILTTVDELEQKLNKVLTISGKTVSASTSFIAAEQAGIAAASSSNSNTLLEPASGSHKLGEATTAVTQQEVKSADTQKSVEPAVEPVKTPALADLGSIEYEVVCDGDVCYKQPKEKVENTAEQETVSTSTQNTEQPAVTETNTRVEEARKMMEEQRKKRIEEEKRLEQERELNRRKEGKIMQNLQQWQRDQELKELKENIRRDRMEEQAARERIRAQIAVDRAERAQKYQSEISKLAASTDASTSQAAGNTIGADSTRIQFRLPDGVNRTQVFERSTKMCDVREFVKTELLPGTGVRNFILATTYPKRELTVEHDSSTLTDLELFPSAVILVIPKAGGGPTAIITRNGGIINIFSTLFWTMMSPMLMVWGYIQNWGRKVNGGANGAQKRASDGNGVQQDAAMKRRNLDNFAAPGPSGNTVGGAGVADNDAAPKPYRRYGSSNIHRLTDNQKDSDDENATWNGNSTQQQ